MLIASREERSSSTRSSQTPFTQHSCPPCLGSDRRESGGGRLLMRLPGGPRTSYVRGSSEKGPTVQLSLVPRGLNFSEYKSLVSETSTR